MRDPFVPTGSDGAGSTTDRRLPQPDRQPDSSGASPAPAELGQALLLAQEVAEATIAEARREAEAILADARAQAAQLAAEAAQAAHASRDATPPNGTPGPAGDPAGPAQAAEAVDRLEFEAVVAKVTSVTVELDALRRAVVDTLREVADRLDPVAAAPGTTR